MVVYVYIYIQSLRPTRCAFIYKPFINSYKIIYKNWKNSLFKATGQERLILRISTPGFTLWTQDIFQYETLHLLSQWASSTPRRTPLLYEALQDSRTLLCSIEALYSKKNSHAVRGPFLTPETSLSSRRQPLHLANTLRFPLHWTSFYSRGHLFDTHEQFEYNTRQQCSCTVWRSTPSTSTIFSLYQ